MTNKIVSVSYNDLLSDKDLTNTIGQAYGQDGLGIILITDYPNLGSNCFSYSYSTLRINKNERKRK